MANHRGPVPDWLTAPYMENILQEGLKSPDLLVKEIDVKAGSKDGDNYACQVFRITVHLKDETEMSVIAKYKPQTQLLESMKEAVDVFVVEAKFFQTMMPILERQLGQVEFAPECYSVDHPHGTIFLEDLVQKGFRLQERGHFLSKEQAVLVVEALASLHGASFYALQENPSLKEAFPKTIWNGQPIDMMKKFFGNTLANFEEAIGSYNLSEKHAKKILNIMNEVNTDYCKVCELQEDRLNFLQHGDAWMNNMMFQFKSNGSVEAVKLLDFQLYNYNCFANDLQYFIFSSVNSQVILEDLDSLLQVYYEKLRTVAPDVPRLTLERVRAEFAERYTFGYIVSICMRPCILSETPPDMEAIINGKKVDAGYTHPLFISELPKFLSFFEKKGLF